MRLTKEESMERYERAEAIIADYERQHEYELPQPWKETVGFLLFRGLTDPELHEIFNTIMRVEHEAGRLPSRKVDYSAFTRKD
jgi:hypothetical protein